MQHNFGTRQDSVAPVLDAVTEALAAPSALNGNPMLAPHAMPSLPALRKVMACLRGVIFPGYFGNSFASAYSFRNKIAVSLDAIHQQLADHIVAGLCFACQSQGESCDPCQRRGSDAALEFMRSLPEIRRMLLLDAQAAYEGDPAATSPAETIFCYPSMTAMFHHRVAHVLYNLKIPLIPRIMAEISHSETGIDIHPGAQIGEYFFIDHGTGVVVGETAIIGNCCRLYQGVTLGALSFPKNPDGSLTKGIARHPVLQDNVTVYAGATILGRITIGKGAVIGGNMWITHDVPAGARLSREM